MMIDKIYANAFILYLMYGSENAMYKSAAKGIAGVNMVY